MSIIIRGAEPGDIPALVALVNRAYRGEVRGPVGRTRPTCSPVKGPTSLCLKVYSATLHDMIFVADEGGVLVGCVEAADQDGIAYIGLLTVEPSRQGGRPWTAARRSRRSVCSWPGPYDGKDDSHRHSSELIAWYERLGYKRTGSCAAFPAHDPRFGTPLRTDLEFVVLEKVLA